MNGQAPNQNGSTPGTQVTPGGKPSVLLDDPIFSAIHDALQMGWSIIELKSRLQVAAMSTSISGPAQTSLAKRPVDSTGGQVDKILQNVLSDVENAKSQLLLPESAILQQQPADSMPSRQNMTDLPDNAWFTSLWRATFSRIAESHKRSFPGSSTANTYYDLPDPPNYQALAASPQGYDASTTYLPYLYLFPAGGQDYGNIGIQRDSEIPSDFKLYDVARRALNCLTLLYAAPEESLIPVTVSEFQNQLVQNISNYRQLTATLSNAAQPQSEPTTPNQPAASQGGEVGQPGTASGATPQDAFSSEEQRNNAIQLVSNQAVHYLETWDSYARETLYVSGGGDAEANEMQLIAYEAGRAMASLSWGITTATVPIEDAMNKHGADSLTLQTHPELKKRLEDTWLSVFDERSITSIQRQVSALSTALDEAYYRVHPNVSRQDANDVAVQPNLDLPSQAIRAVSEGLNYWMRAVQLICTGDTQQQDGTSSNAPSTATDNTVQSRLNALQKDAQNQGSTSSNGDTPATASASGTATIRPQTSAQGQSSTPTNAVTPPRPAAIPAMTWETSSQLRLALIQQAEVWQSLLAGHQSLRDFTASLVTQRIWNDFSQELEQAISKGLLNPVEQQIRRYAIPIAAVVGVLLVIIGVVVFLLVRFPSLQQSLITAFVFIVGSVLGFFGTVASRVSTFFSPASNEQPAAPGSAGAVPAIAGLAGAALIDAFQNGYKQILIEFDYLNHNVAVTYPLVEYFIAHSTQLAKSNGANNTQTISSAQANTNRRWRFFAPKSKESSNQSLASETAANVGFLIKDAYDFLVQIVWTGQERADEIGRIARAAFGPIGAFVGAQITPSSTQNSASSTSKGSASAWASRS